MGVVINSRLKGLLIGCVVLGLGGCFAKRNKEGVEDGTEGLVEDAMQFYGTSLTPAEEKKLLSQSSYYFGYDRFDVNEEDTLSLYAHAKQLLTKPRTQVRIEGHTDERGSREYNIALGERRAKAVANILTLKGVPLEKMTIVSYGKEKPASFGHDESAWQLNRRVVIVYEAD